MSGPDALQAAIDREQGLWKAFAAKDAVELERLITPDAIDVGPYGVLTRDAVIRAVTAMTIRSWTIERPAVLDLGEVQLLTYLSRVDGDYRGKPFEASSVWTTSVWRRTGASFALVHRHETPSREESS